MNLEPAPRLSKSTFLIIDAVLLIAAFAIVYFNAKNPYAPLPFISAVVCVMLAAVIGLIPFLIDYAADSAEYVQQERMRVNDQIQRLQTASESLARAAAQIKAVEEAVHKTAHTAENLPYRMQEKLAEFNQALAEKEDTDREALEEELAELRAANSEQLKLVAEKIQQAAAGWTTLEVATRKQLAAAESAAAKVQNTAGDAATKFEAKLAATLATIDAKLAELQLAAAKLAATPPPAPAPVVHVHHEIPVAPAVPEPVPLRTLPTLERHSTPSFPVPEIPVVAEQLPAATDTALAEPAPAAEEAKPKKPRPLRKPRLEEITAEPENPITVSDSLFSDSAGESAASAAPAEASASSDGATRLLATAYIGIGNKLYIRGDGPGLSWDHGTPMQFVSIGKWGWATHDATAPVTCKLYKNDDTAALTGEVILEPGKHVEITALF